MTRADQAFPAAQGASAAGRPPESELSRDTLRSVFGTFATGITVVTARGKSQDEPPLGMTANSFTSVSLSPPLALVCVKRDAAIHGAILDGEEFAVSVLASGQEQLAKHFANRSRPRGEEEFALVDWVPGQRTGAPILAGALAWMECRLSAVYDGGDHSIFLGSVLDLGHGTGDQALLFHGGRFHRLVEAA
jgi:flavin reductase (DIM6/NTAB) family NADH-FMN oxidoreductase RutF